MSRGPTVLHISTRTHQSSYLIVTVRVGRSNEWDGSDVQLTSQSASLEHMVTHSLHTATYHVDKVV